MCTVTWQRTASGYEVFCNRDERLGRLPGIAPTRFTSNGIQYVAPLDGNFRGTWIGVNEHGLTVCLLNGFAAESVGIVTRGLVTLQLLSCTSVDAVSETLKTGIQLREFAAFTVVAIEMDVPARAFSWDGDELTAHDAEQLAPFTSSSYRPAEVIAKRRSVYLHGGLRGVAYHSSHQGGAGPLSVCMHRANAETVSFTRVSVHQVGISMRYSPQSPCRGIAGQVIELARIT